ncbi:2-methoxy-6-polyprenyl-1,4-benzoquinol methylase, mitochondrial precursor [Danio rerio]|uniref:2-methoxy-6-polyprenyl-1,4-benzoquinol methylase, mitochondrial n=1 Tax=Danio rerio TaxID=7955 RepID=COQ5_DANRE|nr:2-methoxy-6-polyprenyl-1,4-benzoquinol methylase, mitochondrial precursor [Danio rerio]Q66L51.1 RecName: Full=2-methoxy-6-polyprenyl-1,4-benzoquinol methylase, mitochondrial; AltName: Full=Ubiquinone biosynthesis methyltransferase COQ5; Flags: Precursor [Danio rerio]AAH78433.1 Zgc:92445 [Danio rerio]|eukprot:NP_001004541.1 2-methoxy-6-polyprenyl-1,4-benzoquinol methylase, mitochondrial precursor [Danio rerio]
MAAPIRAFVLRVLSDSTRNIHHVLRCRSKYLCRRAAITARRGYSDSTEGRSTHFGFQTVPEEEKAEKVYKVFESVAKKYDVMNDAMSLGIHRLWKDTLLHIMNPQPGLRLLDTAGGTGDISFRFLEYTRSMYDRQQRLRAKSQQTPSWKDIAGHYVSDEEGPPQSRAVVCDINKEMLKVGKQRAEDAGITTGLSWVAGDAEELPFDDDQFDMYTIAFGIRNVTHIEQALQEAFRVLKPGGRFMCLEFSKVTNPLLARLYDAYSFQMIPVLGEVIAGDWKSYQYLVESIRKFPDQEIFKEMIEDAGFFRVQYFNLTGGIVAIHSGFKL